MTILIILNEIDVIIIELFSIDFFLTVISSKYLFVLMIVVTSLVFTSSDQNGFSIINFPLHSLQGKASLYP